MKNFSLKLMLIFLVFGSRHFVIFSSAQVIDLYKIGTGTIDPADELYDYDLFGTSVTSMIDLNGDDILDLAVGAPRDDDGGIDSDRGAVWLLFMQADGRVNRHHKISQTKGGFTGKLDAYDNFGASLTSPGDLNGDGVQDLVVGSVLDDDGGADRGAVWVLFMQLDGQVKRHQKISQTEGGFNGALDDGNGFGISVTSLGDLDGDGVADIAVGAPYDDDGGSSRGAVWVLFMQSDGRVKSHQKISQTEGGFTGTLNDSGYFGLSVTSLGDLDGDGISDLAIGAPNDDVGGIWKGVVWVLFLHSDGRVKGHQKINGSDGGLNNPLDSGSAFGYSATSPGDLDGDGVADLIVGAAGGLNGGSVLILFLQQNAKVKTYQRISSGEGGFTGMIDRNDLFGYSVTSYGDLDRDGIVDLMVGAPYDDDVGLATGAIWVLFLHSDGSVDGHQKISQTEGRFTGNLDDNDDFGTWVMSPGDLNGDGVPDMVVGAPGDDDRRIDDYGIDRGAVWVLFLYSDGRVKSHQKISQTQGGFTGVLDAYDKFGSSITSPGDLNGDSIADLVIGAPDDDDGGFDRGAVWVLFMRSDGWVKSHQKISQTEGGFSGALDDDDFGNSATSPGDLDGDGIADLVVGAPGDDDEGRGRGAIWVLFMEADGRVKRHQKISQTEGGFTGELEIFSNFGQSVTSLGDLNGDGISDLAVGASSMVWVLFMQSDGRVKGHQKISRTEGGLTDLPLYGPYEFGPSVGSLGDLDGDGVADLVVGAPGDDDAGLDRGAAWILFLHSDGRVKGQQKISQTEGGFTSTLGDYDGFGFSVTSPGDLDRDGVADLVIGAPGDDTRGTNRGAVWMLFLNGAPTFGNYTVLSTPVTANKNLILRTVVSDRQGLENAQVHYKRGGDSGRFFQASSLVSSGYGTFEGIIPASLVTDRGVEFYFTAEDVLGLVSRQPQLGVFELRVDMQNKRMPDPFAIDSYRLFSVPLDLKDKSPRAIFENDLGSYDPTIWRFFEPAHDRSPAEFLEYPDIDSIMPGKAYWLITDQESRFIDTGAGTSNPTITPFGITLESGWNYIGNPYTFSVPTINLSLGSGNTLDVRTYDDTGWRPLDESESIEPFSGYIIANTSEPVDTLFIRTEALEDSTAGKRQAENESEAVWQIRLSAESSAASDGEAIASVYEVSDAGWDRLDRPASPQPMGDYVSVYFPHPDWQQHFKHYSIDTRSPDENGEVWDFEVTTNVRDVVTLAFEEIDTIPPEFEVWLVDDAVSLSQNLREVNTYTIAGPLQSQPKQLKLVVGKSGFAEAHGAAELPMEYSLSQNFPNPFNAATTIPYALPGPERVTLTVYSILGERVATILRGEEKPVGYHATIWDGRNDAGQSVASGLYLIQLQAGAFVETRKAMLVK